MRILIHFKGHQPVKNVEYAARSYSPDNAHTLLHRGLLSKVHLPGEHHSTWPEPLPYPSAPASLHPNHL